MDEYIIHRFMFNYSEAIGLKRSQILHCYQTVSPDAHF